MEKFFDKDRLDFTDWLNSQWNLDFKKLRLDIKIQGSPERALCRGVIENASGELFLVEQFSRTRFSTRQTVAQVLDHLTGNGLDLAVGYEKTVESEFLPFFEDHCFGVTRFLDSTVLNRPQYLYSGQMGESFAGFIQKMVKASENMDAELLGEPFSIKTYIYRLFSQMKAHDEKVYDRFCVFRECLEQRFMGEHDQLVSGLCHGDLHPLNVIWENDDIKAVIDWEFVGSKPQFYDAANLVGCAGIENPKGLALPMVIKFLRTLRKHEVIDPFVWSMFPEYVLALRFAWLSEWLRKKDFEMIDMEAAFMQILVDNMDVLRDGWEL